MKKFWLVVIFCSFLFLFPKLLRAHNLELVSMISEEENFTENYINKVNDALNYFEQNYSQYKYIAFVGNNVGKDAFIFIYYTTSTDENSFVNFVGNISINNNVYEGIKLATNNYRYFYFSPKNVDSRLNVLEKGESLSSISSNYDGSYLALFGLTTHVARACIFRTNYSNLQAKILHSTFNKIPSDEEITLSIFDKNILSGDKIPTYYDLNNKPTIKFYTEDVIQNDKLLSMWVYAYFSILDFEKYSYSYRINEKEFIELSENDFEDYVEDDKLLQVFSHKFVNDGSMIVQIRDKLTDEYIAAQSITVSHLGINNPDVVFEEQKYCGGFHQGTIFDSENWNICTRLHFTIEHYELDKHEIFYKIGEDGQRVRTYDETTSIDLYENTRVYVYVYDKSTKTGYTFYYDVTTVDPPNVTNAPYVEGIYSFNERDKTLTLKLFFINYDISLYKYKMMIGTRDRTQLKVIEDIEFDGYKYYSKTLVFSSKTFVVIEVTDINDNYIQDYYFKIEFTNEMKTDYNNFLEEFSEYIAFYKELFFHFWNSLNSNIKSFIIASFSVIVLCAIIVIARK